MPASPLPAENSTGNDEQNPPRESLTEVTIPGHGYTNSRRIRGLPSSESCPVRSSTLKVPRWAERIALQCYHPDIEGWTVRTSSITNPYITTNCRVRDGSDTLEDIKAEYGDDFAKYGIMTYKESARNSRGFLKGWALLQLAVKLKTCGSEAGDGPNRPRIVFRATHDDQPHAGLKARGFGLREVTQFGFQILLQRHLNWRCRDGEPSPFMSVTDDLEKAIRIALFYLVREFPGVKIHVIRTVGPDWDHSKQRMWCLKHLVEKFRIKWRPYFANEWLIKNEIPAGAVLHTWDWNELIPIDELRNAKVKYTYSKRYYEEHKEILSEKARETRELEMRRLVEKYGEPTRAPAEGFNTTIPDPGRRRGRPGFSGLLG